MGERQKIPLKGGQGLDRWEMEEEKRSVSIIIDCSLCALCSYVVPHHDRLGSIVVIYLALRVLF